MSYRYRFYVEGTNTSASVEQVFEYDEEPSPSQLDDDWQDFCFNYFNGGYERLTEDES